MELPGTLGDRPRTRTKPWWPRVGHSFCQGRAHTGSGLCGAEWGSGAQWRHFPRSPWCHLQSHLDWCAGVQSAGHAITPNPAGSSIFSCLLKEVGLTQSLHLLSCPLDVSLWQILSLLAKLNHRGAGVWKTKAASECPTDLHVGTPQQWLQHRGSLWELCSPRVCVWAVCSRAQSQPWHWGTRES